MTSIEYELQCGNTIVCANCPTEIKKGDFYVMRIGWMFCSKECADESGKGWFKNVEPRD